MDGTKRKPEDQLIRQPRQPYPFNGAPTPKYPMYHPESAERSTQSMSTGIPLTYHPNATAGTSAIPRFTPINYSIPSFNCPPSQPQLPPLVSPERRTFGKRLSRTFSSLTDISTNDFNEDEQMHVETSYNADKMRFSRACDPTSWARPLEGERGHSDDEGSLPPQAVSAITRIKRAQLIQDQCRALGITQTCAQNGLAPADDMKWRKDMILSNHIRQIKVRLKDDAVIVVERSKVEGATLNCSHPGCPDPDRRIRGLVLYVVIARPENIRDEDAPHFCLLCFEQLWNGQGMLSKLPVPETLLSNTKVAEPSSIFTLDGPSDDSETTHLAQQLQQPHCTPRAPPFSPLTPIHPVFERAPTMSPLTPDEHTQKQSRILLESLFSSRHAPSPIPTSTQINSETPLHDNPIERALTSHPAAPQMAIATPAVGDDTPLADNGLPSSPGSTFSDGTWRYPPTRLQYIANFVFAGSSQSPIEHAAVKLWKMTSGEQIQWERHMKRAADWRRDWRIDDPEGKEEESVAQKGFGGTNPEANSKLDFWDDHQDQKELEALTKITMKECYGRDLSAVLAMARERG